VATPEEHLMSLQPGTVIAGRYEVVKCLGAGSMGLVYACRHRELTGHLVAVKVLFPEVAQDKVAAARFRNEIFASYGVSHPNVVRAYEYLRDGDLVAYTMEFVGGGALSDRLDSGSPIPVNEVIRFLAQMCAGVQAIHDAGIIHRDLKPENILLTKDGVIKIADFGIARTGHGPKLTEHGGVVGTIDYVSPEYMLNSQVDWRSDIYALGILGYEMLTGEPPFRGDSVYATMTKRLKSDPKPPSVLRPDSISALDTVVLKAMAREPAHRYQSANDMLIDLQKIAPDLRLGSGAYSVGNPSNSSGNHFRSQVQAEEESSRNKEERSSAEGENREADRLNHWSAAETVDVELAYGDTREVKSRFRPSSSGAPKVDRIQSAVGKSGEEGKVVTSERLERVLNNRTREVEGDSSVEISVGQGGIDNHRMRKLNQLAEQQAPMLWVDLSIIIVAIVVGLGVGFALVKVLYPELIGG